MLTIERTRQLLSTQGADSDRLIEMENNLNKTGFLPPNEPLTADTLIAYLIGAASENPAVASEFAFTRGNLQTENGKAFANVLKEEFIKAPYEFNIQSIYLSLNLQYARIAFLDGSYMEFGSYESGAFQRQVFISGGLLSALAMKIYNI